MTYNDFLLIVCTSELLLLPMVWLALRPVGLGPLSFFKFRRVGSLYEDACVVGGLYVASCCYTLVTFTIGIVLKIAIVLLQH